MTTLDSINPKQKDLESFIENHLTVQPITTEQAIEYESSYNEYQELLAKAIKKDEDLIANLEKRIKTLKETNPNSCYASKKPALLVGGIGMILTSTLIPGGFIIPAIAAISTYMGTDSTEHNQEIVKLNKQISEIKKRKDTLPIARGLKLAKTKSGKLLLPNNISADHLIDKVVLTLPGAKIIHIGLSKQGYLKLETYELKQETKVYRDYKGGGRRYAGCWVTCRHTDTVEKPILKKYFLTKDAVHAYVQKALAVGYQFKDCSMQTLNAILSRYFTKEVTN